ncbi:hypothetical protein H0266_17285 [Halobacillus locisalis]|uniref:Uncharacterized protein n=1 Tax=Halobacillus locisalis TaxID=220753 RepID=A0A838CXJ6_9BACI|nr:hypothetical protein [Halobacillus locisalis]MBA2176644.1 hypothetical protein [Halobacillus locisalis]
MSLPTVTLKAKHQASPVTVDRMTIYEQCQIIEARDDENHRYYLFFHKHHYLNYVSASKRPNSSFVSLAFQRGITFSGSHPLTQSLLSPSYKKQNFNTLFETLQHRWGHEETALIATYFHPFIKKPKLAHFIQTLFYKERRNGKMLSCYRILQLLEDFAPNHPLSDAFSGDLQFGQYEQRYKHDDEQLLLQDPIRVEKTLFHNRENTDSYQSLQSLYEKQSRSLEKTALSIDRAVRTQSTGDYEALLPLLSGYSDEDRLAFLTDLYERGLTTPFFLQDYWDTLIKNHRPERALSLMDEHEIRLTPHQSKTLIDLVRQHPLLSASLSPKSWEVLTSLFMKSDQPAHAKEILQQAISDLLNEYDPPYIVQWARPFESDPALKPIIDKLKEMETLSDDPNHQRRLGELYYEFRQSKRAIECMSWDMELYEKDPQPVQWLAKLYQEEGMQEEHKAYQQLYITMMKQA